MEGQLGWLHGWMAGKPMSVLCWLAGWLARWQHGRMAGWLAGIAIEVEFEVASRWAINAIIAIIINARTKPLSPWRRAKGKLGCRWILVVAATDPVPLCPADAAAVFIIVMGP